jgi:hypothetical protein
MDISSFLLQLSSVTELVGTAYRRALERWQAIRFVISIFLDIQGFTKNILPSKSEFCILEG